MDRSFLLVMAIVLVLPFSWAGAMLLLDWEAPGIFWPVTMCERVK